MTTINASKVQMLDLAFALYTVLRDPDNRHLRSNNMRKLKAMIDDQVLGVSKSTYRLVFDQVDARDLSDAIDLFITSHDDLDDDNYHDLCALQALIIKQQA
jgi:hypothetical protein